MDDWSRKHMTAWMDDQRIIETDRDLMFEAYSLDPEFWATQSYWRLFDHVSREKKVAQAKAHGVIPR